jgi:hypothetical protein
MHWTRSRTGSKDAGIRSFLDAASQYPQVYWSGTKRLGCEAINLIPNLFALWRLMSGLQFTAFDPVKHDLAGHAEGTGRFLHPDEAVIVTKRSPAASVKRALSSAVRRIRLGVDVSSSTAMRPPLCQRCWVEGARFSAAPRQRRP